MKAAAPQAPQATAKGGKTAARAKHAPLAPSSAAAAFAGVLARAVAAKDAAPGARAAARTAPAVLPAAANAADGTRAGTPRRSAARAPLGPRADDAEGKSRRAAPAVAAALPLVPAAAPAEMAKAANAASVSAETRRSAPRVQVVDLRRRTPTTAAAADGAEPPQAAAKDARTAESTATAAKPAPERAAPAEPKAVAAAPRATPLDRLREMTGADLVKTAGLVVRDGGGEIRLTLRPGSLGSVRIRLSLEDGKVEGRIVVDTPEARQAFEEGIPALARALQADGFETGALQVSVSGGRSGDQRQAAGLLDDTVAAARLRAIAAPAVEAAVVAAWTGDGLVNVYA